MTTTVYRHPVAPRSFGERAWTQLSTFLTWVGEVYDRKDAAKKSRLSWHYFAA